MIPTRQSSILLPACLMAATGAIVFLSLPLLVGLLMDDLGLNEEQAGGATSTYFASYLLSSASAYFWISRVNLRTAALSGYLSMVAGLLLGTMAQNGTTLALSLAIAGIGGGMLFSLGVALIADGPDTDRNYGWLLVTQQSLAALFLFGAPRWVIPQWGLSGGLSALALVTLLISLSAIRIPARQKTAKTDDIPTPGTSDRLQPRLALVALVVHFAGLSALWAFVERIAVDNGLSGESIGVALSISMLAGLGGALLVTAMADRFGRRIPLWLATGLFLGVCAGFSTSLGWWSFLLLTGLLSFAWNFILAYQMGVISGVDHQGRHAVLIPAAQGLGAVLGPLLGGWGISLGGYPALLSSVGLLSLATALVFTHFARQLDLGL